MIDSIKYNFAESLSDTQIRNPQTRRYSRMFGPREMFALDQEIS